MMAVLQKLAMRQLVHLEVHSDGVKVSLDGGTEAGKVCDAITQAENDFRDARLAAVPEEKRGQIAEAYRILQEAFRYSEEQNPGGKE